MQNEGSPTRVLIIEDNAADATMLKRTFLRVDQAWQLVHVSLLSSAIELYEDATQAPFTLILLDLGLPDATELDGLRILRERVPDVTIVILTGLDDETLALQAMAEGAQDYLVKDRITSQQLTRSIRYAIERQQLLRKIQESERLSRQMLEQEKELNQLKSSFISTVSHEFRNPLAVIRTAADLIRLNGQQIPIEKQQKFLSQIIYSVDNLLDWINEMLLMSRIEAKGMRFAPSWMDFQQFCEQLIEHWQLSAGDRNSISLSITGDCHRLWLDQELLKHVCNNLLSNAVKYSAAGTCIALGVIRQADRLVLMVKDEGIGIPPNQQHQVFDRFYRSDNTEGIAGTGLGLAIVKCCVEAHQGEISLESQLDQGTMVVVTLPCVKASRSVKA